MRFCFAFFAVILLDRGECAAAQMQRTIQQTPQSCLIFATSHPRRPFFLTLYYEKIEVEIPWAMYER